MRANAIQDSRNYYLETDITKFVLYFDSENSKKLSGITNTLELDIGLH